MPFSLRSALRALRHDRAYALLNGVGLAVAFTCCILIGLFARAELSFDRFHADADRLVMIGNESRWGQEVSTGTVVSYPLHLAIEEGTSAADRAVVMSQGAWPRPVALADGEPVGDVRVLMASDGFFEMFSFPLTEGDAATALSGPDGLVVTESVARRLFGDAGALGRTVRVGDDEDAQKTVTGVTPDPPKASTIQFEAVESVLSASPMQRDPEGWGVSMWETAARLAPGATVADLDAQLADVSKTHFPDNDVPPRFFGVPFEDFYLSDLNGEAGFRGDPAYLGLFSVAALLVLLLGGINYVNLATARALRRAREVGVRKALGAARWGVAAQFVVESVVLTSLAAAVALALALALLRPFNAGFTSELSAADLDVPFVLAVAGVAVLVGALAGAYPALVLSGFSPTRVLRGATTSSGRSSGTGLRRVLVVAQFVVAIGLLAGTAAVLRQIAFTTQSDLGFVTDGLVWLPVTSGGLSVGGDREATPWLAAADAARSVPGVAGVVGADVAPGSMDFGYAAPADPSRPDEVISFKLGTVDSGYLDVLGAELVAGSGLEAARPSVVINEALAEALGWTPDDAVGKAFKVDDERQVAGVVRDYHFDSMRSEIGPLALLTGEGPDATPRQYGGVLVRLAPGQAGPALAGLGAAWARLLPDVEFEPAFVDETLAELYDADRRLSGVLGAFALVAIVIACLGLVGLAAYTAERRTKEIGVRRVLGASVRQIVALLTREYALLVALGAAIAVPLAVVGVRRWLEGFVYRADLSAGVFAGVVAAALAVALFVVGAQAVRAARRDPVAALRAD